MNIPIKERILTTPFFLTEGAMVEQLRRGGRVTIDPRLANALVMYDRTGLSELSGLYSSYIDVALEARVPVMIFTPTWRANRERLDEAGIKGDVNFDAVNTLKKIREEKGTGAEHIYIGGLVSCKNDCYKPEEGLNEQKAYDFHSWQIEKLSKAGPDFLIAQTLPYLQEARGLARALALSGLDYFISFVIGKNGKMLDGTSLADATATLDGLLTDNPPLCYMVNCAYPSFLHAGEEKPELFKRLKGFLGNASSLEHHELDNNPDLKADSLSDWGDRMASLFTDYGFSILGGCCGTGPAHLEYLVEKVKKAEK